MSEHGHHGDPHLAHHFENMDQQVNAAKLGMWLFLATEVLLFAGLFCAYAVYRANHPEVFAYASTYLDIKWGAINTLVLLLSSYTVALAVRSSQLGQRKNTTIFLVLTLVGAACFMGIKAIEYTHKFHEDLVWGVEYRPHDPKEREYEGPTAQADEGGEAHGEEAPELDPEARELLDRSVDVETPWTGEAVLQQGSQVSGPAEPPEGLAGEGRERPVLSSEKVENVYWFFGIYFLLTGTHGLHVIFGGLAIGWVLFRNVRGDFDQHYNVPVDLVGLYWHLVDLIWIFLFPLLYLINATQQGQYGGLH